jgi:uncharacterized tellurite resistance protein B-like protein
LQSPLGKAKQRMLISDLGGTMIDKASKTKITSPDAKDLISNILEMIASPNGFAKLSPPQRKFLLAAILGSIVPADGKVKPVEMDLLEKHLTTKYGMNSASLKSALSFASTANQGDKLKDAARYLPDLLSIDDRTTLVGLLWDIALCDHDLHASEDALIYKIADQAGVPRKRVAEQQALAAGHHR